MLFKIKNNNSFEQTLFYRCVVLVIFSQQNNSFYVSKFGNTAIQHGGCTILLKVACGFML